MSCHTFQSADGSVRGFVCLPNLYRFKGYTFEWHSYLGPCPLHKRTLDPRKTIPTGFWKMITEWQAMTKKQQKKYCIYD